MAQATGLFGLRPAEFWELTPREFANMGEGYRMHSDLEWQRTAQLASWIMSAQLGKKAPTADKLLGKDKQRKERTNKVVSIEEKRNTLAELEQSLGKAVN
jgi:Phage tail assembly chaperone protein, TAC